MHRSPLFSLADYKGIILCFSLPSIPQPMKFSKETPSIRDWAHPALTMVRQHKCHMAVKPPIARPSLFEVNMPGNPISYQVEHQQSTCQRGRAGKAARHLTPTPANGCGDSLGENLRTPLFQKMASELLINRVT